MLFQVLEFWFNTESVASVAIDEIETNAARFQFARRFFFACQYPGR